MTLGALKEAAPHAGFHNAAKGLRVALFSGNYNYHKDGAAVTLNRLVAHLEDQGAEVLVFSPTADRPAFDSAGTVVSVPSVPFPGRGEYRVGLGLTPGVRRQLDAFNPNILHLSAPDILGYAALRYGKRHGLPTVASYHTRYDTYLQYYGVSALETVGKRYFRHFYSACDHVYVPSNCLTEVLGEDGITDNVRIWSRGVDCRRLNPDRRDDAWRRSLGIDDSDVVVAFCGRLVREKGLDALIDTVTALTRRGVAHKCLIIGDGPERQMLEARLPEAVFTGFLTGSDLARAYASADIFFNPSQTETFGQVTLEAMASGVPTVCADATGSRSLVRDGVTGFLAPPRDADAYADHIARLIREPALRLRMGAASLAEARRYDWHKVMQSMIENYWDAMAEHTVPAPVPSGPIGVAPQSAGATVIEAHPHPSGGTMGMRPHMAPTARAHDGLPGGDATADAAAR